MNTPSWADTRVLIAWIMIYISLMFVMVKAYEWAFYDTEISENE